MNTINLHNYEAFLLDYYENNLSPLLINELSYFLKKNPQLQIQLEELCYENLSVPKLAYPNKIQLKEHIVAQQIVADLDNELSPQESIELNKLITQQPSFLALKRAYEKTILVPDTLLFLDKNKLKQKEKIIVPLFWRWSAAAILLVFFSISLFWNYTLPTNKIATKPILNETKINSSITKHIPKTETNSKKIQLTSNAQKNGFTAIFQKNNTPITPQNSNPIEIVKDTTTYIIIEAFVEEQLIVIEPANTDELFAEKKVIEPTNPYLVEKTVKDPFLIRVAEKIVKDDIVYKNKKNQKGNTDEFAFQLGTFSISKN